MTEEDDIGYDKFSLEQWNDPSTKQFCTPDDGSAYYVYLDPEENVVEDRDVDPFDDPPSHYHIGVHWYNK